MEDFKTEIKVSDYREITVLYETEKSEVVLVKSKIDKKIYVKKTLTVYNKEVYEKIKVLNSRNLPRIYEIFEEDEFLIVIEEFLNGDNLGVIIEKRLFSEKEALRYMIDLCNAVEELHNLHIIHRDIKPENIIINNDGILKLIDYDSAREYSEEKTNDTKFLGTNGYASPEQRGFNQSDSRTDIYSMGILLNVIITGAHPSKKHITGRVKDIFDKCTKTIPDDRYQSTNELKVDLEKELHILENGVKLNYDLGYIDIVNKERVNENNKLYDSSLDKVSREKEFKNKGMFFKNLNEVISFKKIVNLLDRIKDKFRDFNEILYVSLDEKKKKDKIRKNNINKNIILDNLLGFRTRSLWKSILACLGYSFLLMCICVSFSNSGSLKIFISDIILGIIPIFYGYFFTSNFKNRLPLLRSNYILIKLLGYIIYFILIMLMFVMVIGIMNQ